MGLLSYWSMLLTQYFATAATVVTSILYLLSPSPNESGWIFGLSSTFQPNPSSSYAPLPLFGPPATVKLTPSAKLEGAGFHRRYQLTVAINRDADLIAEDCSLTSEWTIGREFIVDKWLLQRSQANVLVQGNVDLEAPAYSEKATSFTLSSKSLLKTLENESIVKFVIPDISLRYGFPGGGLRSIKIPIPRLELNCGKGDFVFRVDEIPPFFASIPIANPSLMVNNATVAAVVLCLFYLLFQLYKA